MIETFSMPFPRQTSKKQRKVYVYLPEGFEPDAAFPVLYMFDGHNVFFDEDATYGKSWGMKEYLENDRTPLVVVAVDCNHSPDHGRLKEYAPFYFQAPGIGQIRGRGHAYMEWLTQQLKPFIDEHYPVLPDRENTFIAGSSMGGLMTLYAMCKYGSVFSRGAALSPSIGFDPKQVLEMIDKTKFRKGTLIYMDYGEKEISYRNTRNDFADVSAALIRKKVMLESRVIPDGEHNEASWEKQVPFFMDALFYEL